MPAQRERPVHKEPPDKTLKDLRALPEIRGLRAARDKLVMPDPRVESVIRANAGLTVTRDQRASRETQTLLERTAILALRVV